jgi:amicyanin
MRLKGILIFTAIILLTACGSNAMATRAANAPAVPVTGGTNVTIANFAFSPADVTVKVGTTVTWTNKDTASHNVLAVDSSWGSTNLIKTGQTYSFTFTKAGTYPYRCGIHPNMKATVRVIN